MSSTHQARNVNGSIPLDWFQWLPLGATGLLEGPTPPTTGEEMARRFLSGGQTGPSIPAVTIERALGDRLAAVDRLRPGDHSLRVGWLFIAGTSTGADGKSRTIFQPLVSRPVRVQRSMAFGPASLLPAGDLELTSLVTDRDRRLDLEHGIEWGGGALDATASVAVPPALLARLNRLRSFALDAAQAAGFSAAAVVPAGDDPQRLMRREPVVVVAGTALYATAAGTGLSPVESLLGWASRPFRDPTAFHLLYHPGEPQPDPHDESRTLDSPFELTPAQRDAVLRSRHAPVTVLSGPPGTGKSHTIAAIACDALGRGETVLMAARSAATVDALVDLFERGPGPHPIVFGSNERREALAARLAGGLVTSASVDVDRALERLRAAISDRDELRHSIAERLATEQMLATPAALARVRRAWPALFGPGVDLDGVAAVAARAAEPGRGWRARRRTRHAERELAQLVGAPASPAGVPLGGAIDMAQALCADRYHDGVTIADREWDDLLAAESEVRRRAGEHLDLDSRSSSRHDRVAVGAVSALATALRSGRAARREQLEHLDRNLTRALPLWVGTLADIEDLLPSEPGLFDLVVLDEASSIDQPTAAAALLRGGRAVVVGDPRQLRHVSFVGDDQRQQALESEGIDPASFLGARLDVRRNSTFDVAAAASNVLTLDEQFRCDPHLVEFVAHRLYDGEVHVARRSPSTESVDCVDLVRVDGVRDEAGVVRAEVRAVLDRLRRTPFVPGRTVGVVSPFRAQADALEAAILEEFTIDEIESLDLRVGTVHAFQGNERDLVIASLGLGADVHPSSWRFVQDPHLFTVLVTRARAQFVIVSSADPPAGLVEDYLAQADAPPGPPRPRGPADRWAEALAEDLAALGSRTLLSYPSGRHTVDLVVGDANGFLGLECAVHPDGPKAHIDRHLALASRGWHLREAFQRRWADRRGELVVELSGDVQSRVSGKTGSRLSK